MTKSAINTLWTALLLFAVAGYTTAQENNSATAGEATANAADWGIHNGCIRHTLIKRVNFTTNDSGIIELANGRKVQVSLRNRCPGIRNEGYVHKPINGQFCQGDSLRVINYGHVCIVDEITPYIPPDEP